jgi:hypothetical protein
METALFPNRSRLVIQHAGPNKSGYANARDSAIVHQNGALDFLWSPLMPQFYTAESSARMSIPPGVGQ